VPLAQFFAQIERKIRNIEKSKITSLITENESLKAELNTLKQEVDTVQQKNLEGITLDILALTKVVMDRNKELMCFECGNIYFESGYKIIKVSVAEGPTNLSFKTEHAITTTHRPTKPRRSQRHKVAAGLPTTFKKEPLFPSRVVSQETQTDYVLQDKETQTDC
jgi:regulator of replication initiation timing